MPTTTGESNAISLTLATYFYDTRGLVNRTDLRQHDTANYGPGFTYRGNVSRSVTPGKTLDYDYDIAGAPVTVNSLSQQMQWNSFLGLTQVTGANGETASYGYDCYARPASTTSPYGAQTTMGYTVSPPTRTASINGRWTKTTMDSLGRTVKVESGHGSTTVSVTETEYGPCACSPVGKVKRVSQPYAPGGTKYWTEYTWDALGRTVSVIHAGNTGTTNYVYEGNTVKVTDPAGKWKKYRMDAFGNLTKVWEPNPAGGADYETNYTYSMLNQLLTVQMPRVMPGGNTVTQTRTFVYNSDQRLLSVTHPESGTTSYTTYNGDGTVATKTDAKGQRTEYTYRCRGAAWCTRRAARPAIPTTGTARWLKTAHDTSRACARPAKRAGA